MMTMTKTLRDFDHEDYLNDDGTVTIRCAPSTWHVYNMAPDTYSMFTGDCEIDSLQDHLEYSSLAGTFGVEYTDLDGHDIEFNYDHFDWTFNHDAIVRDLSQELADWIAEELWDQAEIEAEVTVRDTWSPKEYNFTSDGFEIEVTLNPETLRAATGDFDVDEWAAANYGSRDGFLSFVTGRMRDDDWAGEYDGGFRLEYLMDSIDSYCNRDWISRLAEAEGEIYSTWTTVTPRRDEIRETILEKYGYMDSGYTLEELTLWAQEITEQDRSGMDPMFY